MSLSNSRASYDDCFALLDEALDQPRGIRVRVANIAVASHLRMRIHQARQIDRSENRVTYAEPDHPLHNRSPYDLLVCRIEPDGDRAWLWLDKQKVEIEAIEPIGEGDRMLPAAPTPLLIEHQPVQQPTLVQVPQIRRR